MNSMCTVNISYIFPIDCSVKLYLKLAAILDYSFTHEKKQGSFMYGLIPNSSVDCKNIAQPFSPIVTLRVFPGKNTWGGSELFGHYHQNFNYFWGTTT